MKSIGMLLLFSGAFLFAAGLLILLADKIPWLGNLPGDIHLKFKNMRIHLPLMTCIIISIILTVVINILFRFFRK